MKTSELTGGKLDYWVAKAQGWSPEQVVQDKWLETWWFKPDEGTMYRYSAYKPTTNWQQCGELIEKFNLNLLRLDDGWKSGYVYSYADKDVMFAKGSTPQEAICRAVVASVYGEEVSDD